MDHQIVAQVLAEIARTASETLELGEIFDRVAASARRLIPLDEMGVCRVLEDGSMMKHASTVAGGCPERHADEPVPLTEWSPRIRPRLEPVPLVNDAQIELDPTFTIDARILANGGRSLMCEPFRESGSLAGGVWVSARQPNMFTDDHQKLLAPIAALIGSAVSHWKIWDAERRRRTRLDQLEILLATLAGALDVREIFESISTAVNPVLPHSLLALSEHDVRARSIKIAAIAGQVDVEVPDGPIPMTDAEVDRREMDHELVRDVRAEIAPETPLSRLHFQSGMRSTLRVPVRLSGEVRGSLVFMHREMGMYDTTDV
ncbi:MAG TPA: GAF domain-containing protein, partial [Candidatus Polarisedimenticolia bacterium]|nr:GAF domain-containing protein [Candidatus Polarisedimenticolia bacterium]